MMKQYHDLLKYILENGESHEDRTGVGTLSTFVYQMRFNLREGFPLLTTKRLPFRWIAEELFWFLSGNTNEKALRAKGVDIWQEWATPEKCAKFSRVEGDLGPVYGHLWRHFGSFYNKMSEPHVCRACQDGLCQNVGECYDKENERNEEWPTPHCAHNCEEDRVEEINHTQKGGIDQIARLMHDIQENPFSRRHLVTGWDPRECDHVELPPCHTVWQIKVHPDMSLSLHLFARSIDSFLGLPFNIASYALLLELISHCTTRVEPRELVISVTDLHIYKNHLSQVEELLSREPYPLPELEILDWHSKFHGLDGLLSIKYSDLKLHNYRFHPAIRADVAI